MSGHKMRQVSMHEGPFLPVCTGYSQEIRHRGESEGDEDQGGALAKRVNRREADGIGSWVGSGRLKERGGLHWRTGWGFGGQT